MASDILKPISNDNISSLLQVLSRDMPTSTVVYNWIKKQTEWQTKIPNLKVQVLCPNGDWSDGTVVGISSGLVEGDMFTGVIYTMEENGEKLKNALIKTKIINWEKFAHLSGVITKHVYAVEAALQTKGIKIMDLTPCQLHHLTAEDAEQLQVPQAPEGVRIGPLKREHLDIVCENWPHYLPPFRPVIEHMIDKNPSVGVFVTDEGEEEQLAAMVLQADYGGIGLLQTVPKFRRRGFASIAITNQVYNLGQKGIDPHFHVINNNYSALAMVKKLGFKIVGESNWILSEKNIC